MKKLIALIGLLIGLGVSQVATAYEWVDFNTVRVTFSYTEPTENTDGSALTDLAVIVPYYRHGSMPEWVALEPIAASTPNGGATVTALVNVPPESGDTMQIEFVVTARTSGELESEYSAVSSLFIVRPNQYRIRPNVPAGFAVQ